EVMEMLKANGLSCLVDRSSYENDPLGRAEWVRFYGLIAGREDEAEKVFSDVKKKISLVTSRVKTPDGDRPKVAFFSVTPAGYANVRRPGDYVSRMIEMAGGINAFGELDAGNDNSVAMVKIGTEELYSMGASADVIIYNSAIQGSIGSIEDLTEKASVLKEFKAVKEARVYCTTSDIFQSPMAAADMLEDMYSVINEDKTGENGYIYKVPAE
nr:ABC transporter substrate-binding protein [Lachnospiraceae bacterium]